MTRETIDALIIKWKLRAKDERNQALHDKSSPAINGQHWGAVDALNQCVSDLAKALSKESTNE